MLTMTNHGSDLQTRSDDLASLVALTEQMWRDEPALDGDRRSAALSELIEVGIVLDLMSLRVDATPLESYDDATIAECAARLRVLSAHWTEVD